ncbi:lysophospholipid acyltransferase LPEAT2-like isoform X2 [Rutidosis leptorrhynchoides]|uniref:lysophospholipid acyltransferase LPEAT2-like isoform X2 n=1 Tax=Rutidosis leptorrhynchoides TaxID=125765 RepID=UPI003A99E221
MSPATDLRRPLIHSIAGAGVTHTDDNSPSHHILTINDQLGSPQFATPTNQVSILNDTQLDINDGYVRSEENPYGIIGSDGIEAPGSTTVDPFRNTTPNIEGLYEWVKMLVILPIVLVRLVLFLLCLIVGYGATNFALHGWKDKQNPMPKWRCRVMWITRLCARGILFSFGYHWIKRKGKPASRDTAPIIVSNHVSYIDPIFFFYESSPTIVASESHDSMPFVGVIIRAMQVIYVNRFSYQSRKHAVNEIKRKASSNKYPRVLLFPEGTTTNGRQLISFQLGAFISGYPIQPVVIRYPHVHFDQSWGHIALATLMFRMFMQFHNFMEVEYLPVITPSQHQKESAARFAERTGKAMACALNVVQTHHSFADYALLSKAADAGQESFAPYMVEMAKVQKLCHLTTSEAVDFLDRFLAMKPDSSGCVNYQDFTSVLRLKPSILSENIFGFLDVDKNGFITFKEFLVGSVHVLKLPLFRRACEVAFCESDAGKDQYISLAEFESSVRPAILSLTSSELLFHLFDTDGDGKISKDDFINCLKRNPLLIAHFNHHFMHQNLDAETCLEETV